MEVKAKRVFEQGTEKFVELKSTLSFFGAIKGFEKKMPKKPHEDSALDK